LRPKGSIDMNEDLNGLKPRSKDEEPIIITPKQGNIIAAGSVFLSALLFKLMDILTIGGSL
tara:strand:- start:1188 stop:1370 length:183 start_codon:yes stop_codon:yes gene_type:complete